MAPRERTVTELELIPAHLDGNPGWVVAEWTRSDGSTGRAAVTFRLRAAERWYIARLHVTSPTTPLLREIPLARIESAANASPEIRAWLQDAAPEETVKRAETAAAARPRLRAPDKRQLTGAFFVEVADAYRGAVVNGLPPAKTMAVESGVPQGTVNRWIAEARRRGHLPPASPGRVSA